MVTYEDEFLFFLFLLQAKSIYKNIHQDSLSMNFDKYSKTWHNITLDIDLF